MRKNIAIIGIVVGIIFIILGIMTKIPGDYIYNLTEYVGGDAYNYIIESSIRAGKISGAMTQRAVYIAVGVMMTFLATFKLCNEK